jgi:predicted ATPase
MNTMATANVVDLLPARMRKLPENVQRLIQYTACLGSSISLTTLDVVWTKDGIEVYQGQHMRIL